MFNQTLLMNMKQKYSVIYQISTVSYLLELNFSLV